MNPILPELRCDAIGPCRVVGGKGTEAMNALSRWCIDVLLPDATLDVARALRAPATLLLADGLGWVRPIGLIVTGIAYESGERDGHRFVVELAPPEWLLSRRAGYHAAEWLLLKPGRAGRRALGAQALAAARRVRQGEIARSVFRRRDSFLRALCRLIREAPLHARRARRRNPAASSAVAATSHPALDARLAPRPEIARLCRK
jgi:hypothetical protein